MNFIESMLKVRMKGKGMKGKGSGMTEKGASASTSSAIEREVQRRLTDILAASGVAQGRLSLECLYMLPPELIRSYTQLFDRALREGVVSSGSGPSAEAVEVEKQLKREAKDRLDRRVDSRARELLGVAGGLTEERDAEIARAIRRNELLEKAGKTQRYKLPRARPIPAWPTLMKKARVQLKAEQAETKPKPPARVPGKIGGVTGGGKRYRTHWLIRDEKAFALKTSIDRKLKRVAAEIERELG